MNREAIARAWLPTSVAIVLMATLTPQPGSSNLGQGFFAPPLSGSFLSDLLQNVLLYVPLGLVLGLRGHTSLRTALGAAALSLATELGQFLVPGRDPVATDVAINAIGASIGWAAARARPGPFRAFAFTVERWLILAGRPERRIAATLSLAWAAAVSSVVTVTLWLLSPALPAPFYFLVGTPIMDVAPGPWRIGSDGRYGVFRGLIDEVRIYSNARSRDAIRADMARAVSASPPEPDLVAAYGFDSSEQGTALDTAAGRHAVVRGAAWSESGRFGGALVFDGRTSAVVTPPLAGFDFHRALTIEAWVNPSERQRGSSTIVADEGGAFSLRASTPGVERAPVVVGTFGKNTREARSRARMPASTWTHLAAVYDGRAIALYVNARPQVRLRHWSTHHPLRMSLDHLELVPGLVRSPTTVHALLSGDFRLGITLKCGELEREASPVFALTGVQSLEVLNVDASGTDVRVRWLSRAKRLGLVPAEYRVPQAIAGCAPGQTRSLTVMGPLNRPRIVDHRGTDLPGDGPGVGSAWAFFVDSRSMPGWLITILSAGYLALLALPFGFWARATSATMFGILLLGGVLALVPASISAQPVEGVDMLALATGALLGAVMRLLMVRDAVPGRS